MAVEKGLNLMPGNPVYVGDKPALEMDLSIMLYDSDTAQMKHLSDIDELEQFKKSSKISWISISGLKDVDSIKRLGDLYDIHPLSIEDILNTEQQPKIEIFDEYRFLSIKTIQQEKNFHHKQEGKKKPSFFFQKNTKEDNEIDEFIIDQVSIIIMKDVLITFEEIPGGPFEIVRKRILEDLGGIRKMGTDYLAYSIIDAIVDEYLLAINHLEEDIENFEERATKTTDDTFIGEIQDTKKYLLQIKRALSPAKDTILIISRHRMFFQTDELKPYLQDLYENLNHAMTMIENHREWLTNIMDVNLSVLSHQMNKVMKVLATISTIFIPLTFIAGIYGMNFVHMPELEYEIAYPIVLCFMVMVALTMIVIFKIRHWF